MALMAAPPPRVFISYAWGDDSYKARVLQLAAALRTEAGVDVVLDSWDLRAGQDMTVFTEQGRRGFPNHQSAAPERREPPAKG